MRYGTRTGGRLYLWDSPNPPSMTSVHQPPARKQSWRYLIRPGAVSGFRHDRSADPGGRVARPGGSSMDGGRALRDIQPAQLHQSACAPRPGVCSAAEHRRRNCGTRPVRVALRRSRRVVGRPQRPLEARHPQRRVGEADSRRDTAGLAAWSHARPRRPADIVLVWR